MLAYKVESIILKLFFFLLFVRRKKLEREKERKVSSQALMNVKEREFACILPFSGLETRETEKLWSESARDGDEYICEGKTGRKRGEEGGGGIQGMKEEFENIIETKSEIMKLEEEEKAEKYEENEMDKEQ
uniref:Uncharacterized protein n=1 Tax=Cacopsylla melanoneura TaxID=428564 RepID=A0A8D8ZCQ1_9HEMI